MSNSECNTKAISQDDDEADNQNDEEEVDDGDGDDNNEDYCEEDEAGEAVTCSALCTLGASDPMTVAVCTGMTEDTTTRCNNFSTTVNMGCPKQLQLPMFLSSTLFVSLHVDLNAQNKNVSLLLLSVIAHF
jgi:hypothetical protein